MNLNIQDWKPFVTSRLFYDMQNGKANQQMLDEGNECFYVGAKKDDNGVMVHCLRDESLMTKGNCIIFICNGQGSVGYANYMDVDFIGTTDIVAGYNDNLNSEIGTFLATIYSQERPKYSFGRKWKTKLADTEIKLPVQHNADGSIFIDGTCKYSDEGYAPDWQFMEDYIKSLHYKPLTTKNKREQTPDLNVQDWKEFTIEELFPKLVKGKCGDASSLIDGNDVNYIGAKYDNNGVMKSCSLYDNLDFVSEGNCIAMIGQGQGSAGYAIYLDTDFIGATSLSLGYADWINPYTAHFVTTLLCLEYDKYSFGRSWTGDRLKETIVKLPVGSDGDPDWQFMENYIKALPYGDRLEV